MFMHMYIYKHVCVYSPFFLRFIGSLLPISLITLSPFTMTPSGGKVDCAETNLVMYSQSLAQKLPEVDLSLDVCTYTCMCVTELYLLHGWLVTYMYRACV